MPDLNHFPNVGWENLANRELEDRRARDRLQMIRATPELARGVADLSHYYPNLSGGVITAAALGGLQPGSPEMATLAQRSLERSIVDQPKPNPLGRILKGTLRGLFTAFDFVYREVVQGGSSFLVGLGQGLSASEAAEGSFGFSGGATALASLLQGRPVNLGSGILPGGDLAPETEQLLARGVPFEQAVRNPAQGALGIPAFGFGEARRETEGVRVGATATNAGVPVTPGRALASVVFEPGDRPFHYMSGILDATANLIADPGAKIAKGLGVLRMANRMLVPNGVRPAVLQRGFTEWAASPHGLATTDLLARTDDYLTIHNMVRKARSGDARLALELTDARDAGRITKVLADAVNEGRLTNVLAPQSLAGRGITALTGRPVASAPSALLGGDAALAGIKLTVRRPHQAGFMARMAAEVGARALDPTDLDGTVASFGDFLKVADFDQARTSHYMAEMTRRVLAQPDVPLEPAFAVFREAMGEFGDRLVAAGYSRGSVKAIQRVFSDVEEYRKFWLDAAGRPQYHPSARYHMMANGEIKVMPDAHTFTEFIERNIPLPDIRAVRETVRRLDLAERTGGRVKLSMPDFEDYRPNVMTLMADNFMTKVWKPMVLLRVAWPVRVIAEEQMRMAAAGLDSMFSHPISYLAWMIGRKGGDDLFDNSFDAAAEWRAAASRRGGHWADRGPRGREPYSDEWILRERDVHRRWIDGAAINLEKMWNDELGPVVAQVADPDGLAGVVSRLMDGDLAHLRRRLVADGRAEYRSVEAVDAYVQSVWARIHQYTGGSYVWRHPETGRWHDMWGEALDLRSSANRTLVADAAPGAEFIVTRPGNTKLIESLHTKTLDGIDLTDLHPGASPAKFRQVINHLDANYRDSLPQFTAVATKEVKGLGARWDRAVDHMMTLLMSKPTNLLSRSPAFRQYFWKRVGQMLPAMDEGTRAAVVAQARKAGINRTGLKGFLSELHLTDDAATIRALDDLAGDYIARVRKLPAEQRLADAGQATLHSWEEVDEMAKAFALEETRRLLYDTAKRHNVFDMTRNLFPFGEAWFEILSTWTRLMTENPAILRRGQQFIEGARREGFFYTDPDTNEEVFNYPGLGLLSRWMFEDPEGDDPYAYPRFTGRVEGLNIALGAFMPGFGPLLQVPASFFTPLTRDPDWKWARELVIPFGPAATEPTAGAIVDSIFPAWVKKGWIAMFGDDVGGDQTRLLANTTMNVYAAMLQNGEVEQTPDGMNRAMETARRRARAIFAIRGLVQFGGPTGPGVRWDVEVDPDGQVLSFQALAQGWREMLERSGGDEAATFDEFTTLFGLDPTAIVTAKSRQIVPRSVTEEGLAFQAENEQLFEDYPFTAYFAHPDPADGEFSYQAYLSQLESGTREALTEDEWLSQRNRLLGEIAYQNARNLLKDEEGKVRTDDAALAWLRAVRHTLIREFPGFGFDTPGVAASATSEQLRLEFERWSADPFLSATQGGRALGLYLRARDAALAAAAERHGISEGGFGSAISVAYLREWLRGVAEWVAMNTADVGVGAVNPDFVAIFERAYDAEISDTAGEAQLELLGETFPVGS